MDSRFHGYVNPAVGRYEVDLTIHPEEGASAVASSLEMDTSAAYPAIGEGVQEYLILAEEGVMAPDELVGQFRNLGVYVEVNQRYTIPEEGVMAPDEPVGQGRNLGFHVGSNQRYTIPEERPWLRRSAP